MNTTNVVSGIMVAVAIASNISNYWKCYVHTISTITTVMIAILLGLL